MKKSELGFLVVGVGRGGTSLLMGMLDVHSELEVAMEAHAMDALMGLSLDEPSKHFRHELAPYRCRVFASRCQLSAQQIPDKYFGNKITAEQIYGLHDHVSANGENFPYLQELFGHALAGVKVIYIMRDARTNVRSKVQRTDQGMEHAVARYQFGLRVWRYLKNNHPDFISVKYEELVRHPQQVLQQICDFLGVSYESSMLAGVANQKMPGDYQNTQLDITKLHLQDIPPGATGLLFPLLRETGYIGRASWWFYRIRYSRWWGGLGLVGLVLGLGVVFALFV